MAESKQSKEEISLELASFKGSNVFEEENALKLVEQLKNEIAASELQNALQTFTNPEVFIPPETPSQVDPLIIRQKIIAIQRKAVNIISDETFFQLVLNTIEKSSTAGEQLFNTLLGLLEKSSKQRIIAMTMGSFLTIIAKLNQEDPPANAVQLKNMAKKLYSLLLTAAPEKVKSMGSMVTANSFLLTPAIKDEKKNSASSGFWSWPARKYAKHKQQQKEEALHRLSEQLRSLKKQEFRPLPNDESDSQIRKGPGEIFFNFFLAHQNDEQLILRAIEEIYDENGMLIFDDSVISEEFLFFALEHGHVNLLKYIGTQGGLASLHYERALFIALQHGHSKIIQELIEGAKNNKYHININHADPNEDSVFHIAARGFKDDEKGKKAAAGKQLILSTKKMQPEAKAKPPSSVLAKRKGQGEKRTPFMKYSCQILFENPLNKHGQTALHCGCNGGDPEITMLLIEHRLGNLTGPADKEGLSPLAWIFKSGNEELLRRLLATRPQELLAIRCNNASKLGQLSASAQQYASWYQKPRMVRMLIEAQEKLSTKKGDEKQLLLPASLLDGGITPSPAAGPSVASSSSSSAAPPPSSASSPPTAPPPTAPQGRHVTFAEPLSSSAASSASSSVQELEQSSSTTVSRDSSSGKTPVVASPPSS